MLKFRYAPEVKRIADRLISLHHKHLLNVDMRYFWGEEAPVKGNKTTLGTAQRVSGLKAAMAFQEGEEAEEFFAITIFSDMWVFLDDAQREALIDHELCHCEVGNDQKGNKKLKIKQHDIEEFGAIVERHGLWDTDLKEFAQSLRKTGQLTMELNEEQRAIHEPVLRGVVMTRENRHSVLNVSTGQDAIDALNRIRDQVLED